VISSFSHVAKKACRKPKPGVELSRISEIDCPVPVAAPISEVLASARSLLKFLLAIVHCMAFAIVELRSCGGRELQMAYVVFFLGRGLLLKQSIAKRSKRQESI
jgi:hypothetical protein